MVSSFTLPNSDKLIGRRALVNMTVTLGLGIRLVLGFLRVGSVLAFLLLPPVTQIRGKRVFWVM